MKPCKFCGDEQPNHWPYQCKLNPKVIKQMEKQRQQRQPIKKKGPRTIEYEHWRDTVAKPYLDKHFGRQCADCGAEETEDNTLDVDHIVTRGSRTDLKMNLDNVQYLCNYPCHFNKTNKVSNNV